MASHLRDNLQTMSQRNWLKYKHPFAIHSILWKLQLPRHFVCSASKRVCWIPGSATNFTQSKNFCLTFAFFFLILLLFPGAWHSFTAFLGPWRMRPGYDFALMSRYTFSKAMPPYLITAVLVVFLQPSQSIGNVYVEWYKTKLCYHRFIKLLYTYQPKI